MGLERFREITTASETLYKGRVINLRKDEVRLSNGHITQREIVEHHGAICVVPVLDDGKIMMVRQFRKPAEQALLELPAGSLEIDEDPLFCAHRELVEECGLKATQMTPLFQCYLAPGYSSEYMYGFVARGLEKVAAQPEADEILELESYSLLELLPMIVDGRIRDAKTICGVLMLQNFESTAKS
ncbi:MAG: NUDIX hydrolase [Abditibacteriaceae bacterium]